MKKTFAHMTEKVSKFPFLRVTPPLQLKEAGQSGPLPVLLSEGTAVQLKTIMLLCMYVYTRDEMVTGFWINQSIPNSQDNCFKCLIIETMFDYRTLKNALSSINH